MAEPFLRPLGDSGLQVSAIGLGTVKIGRNQGVKYPRPFDLPDDRAVTGLLSLARDLGINLIDTAPAYGISEERLGQLLTRRDEWVLVSKAGEEFIDGESRFDFSADALRRSVERSLQRLKTDYLDVLLIHSSGDDLALIEQHGVLDTVAELKRTGLIRSGGMSTKTVAGGLATLQHADVAMVTYNLQDTGERPVIDYAAAHHKGILVKKAFASGHVCEAGDDPVTASLEQVLGAPGVSAVIAGTINEAHLRENVDKARAVLQKLNSNDE